MSRRHALTQVSGTHQSTPSVSQHDVVFQFRFALFRGGAVPNTRDFYTALDAADAAVGADLLSAISGGESRLGLYPPEFSDQREMGACHGLYEIGVFCHEELPLRSEDTSTKSPISVEQLIDEVPAALATCYAEAGITLELVGVRFHKQCAYAEQGSYSFK